MPRLGTRYSMRARPKPGFAILTMRPRRSPRRSVTMPMNCSGTSITTSSIGSHSTPSTVLRHDLGVAELHLVALAPHRLDEDRELELAAAEHA